jgi:hypothetical protein
LADALLNAFNDQQDSFTLSSLVSSPWSTWIKAPFWENNWEYCLPQVYPSHRSLSKPCTCSHTIYLPSHTTIVSLFHLEGDMLFLLIMY